MPHIGQPCVYYADYRDGVAHPEAAIITAVIGERVNLVYWSPTGIQSARSDVTQSREACPGCWSPLPAAELPAVDVPELVRAEVARLLAEPTKKQAGGSK
jgi:hypothetical protein